MHLRASQVIKLALKLLGAQESPSWLEEFLEVGGEVDPEGFATVYHATTANYAKQILREQKLIRPPNTPDAYGVYVSSSPSVARDHGDGTVLKLKVDLHDLILDDSFLANRVDFLIETSGGFYTPHSIEPLRMRPISPRRRTRVKQERIW